MPLTKAKFTHLLTIKEFQKHHVVSVLKYASHNTYILLLDRASAMHIIEANGGHIGVTDQKFTVVLLAY